MEIIILTWLARHFILVLAGTSLHQLWAQSFRLATRPPDKLKATKCGLTTFLGLVTVVFPPPRPSLVVWFNLELHILLWELVSLNYKHLTHCFDSICLKSFDCSFDCFGRPLRNCTHISATKTPKQVEMIAANVELFLVRYRQ